MESYNDLLKKLAPKLINACTPENKRTGGVEAFNMPSDLNAEIHSLYERYGTKYEQSGRLRWTRGLKMTGDECLDGYTVGYYGRNADKFYLFRFTQEQNNQILRSIAKAAVAAENPHFS